MTVDLPTAPRLSRQPVPPRSTPAFGGRRRWAADLITLAGVAGLVFVVALWRSGGGIEGFADPGGVGTEIGRLTGLIASYLLLVQVLLMARIPWLEGIWGQDRLARVHRWVGFASFDLMVVHIVAITLGYAAAADTGVLRELWVLLTEYPGMLLAGAGTVSLIMVVVTSIRAARRRMRYESWHLIHLYAYIGVGLALPHQLWTGGDFVSSPIATVFWWSLWGTTAGAVIAFRLLMPIYRSLRHAIVVDAVIRESRDVVSVYMRGRDLDRLGLRAGQFCQWRFLNGPGWTRAHPFTVSAAPTRDRLRITLRETGDGTRAHAYLRPGSRVIVEGPYGVMTAARRHRRDVLMIAAGVGLTTMRGLTEEIAAEPRAVGAGGVRVPSIVVLHRVSAASDTLFADEFRTLGRSADVVLGHLVGRRSAASGWWGGARPIDPTAALRQSVPDLLDREVYVCGPPDWMRDVRASLRQIGIPAKNIHHEEFSW